MLDLSFFSISLLPKSNHAENALLCITFTPTLGVTVQASLAALADAASGQDHSLQLKATTR